MPNYTPEELLEMYSDGFKGTVFDPQHYEQFLSELKYSDIYGANPLLSGSGAGKLSTPYKSVIALSPVTPYLERQVTGDCVSHSTRNAGDISRAVEIHVKSELEAFVTIGATEAIYGSRGFGGQGMSCSRAAAFLTKDGGILLRKKYDGFDLTNYQGMLGAGWGSRGIPKVVREEAVKHKFMTSTLIRSVAEARDALANGYGISVCSNYGFSSVRDKNGIARPQGSWNHAMCWTACDDTKSFYSGTLFLVQNSWGKFNSGGHPPWGPIPDGSFLITEDVADRMIRQGGAFVFSSFDGFPLQKLPNYGVDI